MCKSRKTPKQTGLDKMLVKIADRKGNNLVSARELHKVVQVKEAVNADAVEDKEFLCLNKKTSLDVQNFMETNKNNTARGGCITQSYPY